MVHSSAGYVQEVRRRVCENTGVPEDRILVCATHTHSGPDLESPLPCIAEYKKLYVEAFVDAAEEALADLAPAKLFGASTETENMAYVRHYLMDDGTYARVASNGRSVVRHACKSDQEILITKLEREEKPSILMINYQVHPTAHGGATKPDISGDFIYNLREYMEATTGMHFAYFTGAAGNQTVGTRIPEEGEKLTSDQLKKFGGCNPLIYAWRMAQYIAAALPKLKEIPFDGIFTQRLYFDQPVCHDDAHLLDVAIKVREIFESDIPDAANIAREYGKERGISSVYHAGAIRARAKRPQTQKMELNAVRIGRFAFGTFPFETFRTTGVYGKAHSPFPITMVFSCANEHWSYLPTAEAFDYGCYESSISYFARGAAEAASEKMTEMLKSLL